MEKVLSKIRTSFADPYKRNARANKVKEFFIKLLWFAIIVGVAYVILAPIISMLVNSFSSNRDCYDPMVFIRPKQPTLERYKTAILRMDYFKTLGANLLYVAVVTIIQLFVCSMVGYGFARFDFPGKKILFGCVVVMIVLPVHTIMLPLYVTFREFNPFGIVSLLRNGQTGLMATPVPMVLMSLLGCGLRSGLFIYIFNQFFRGLPKEIEEAALVDGCGLWYTYFRIMLVNAMPAVITVTVFSIVWQFNDTFYADLFRISEKIVLSKRVATLQAVVANQDKVMEIPIQQLYLHAGIILVILPVLIIYLILQRQFIEGVERSGIVG